MLMFKEPLFYLTKSKSTLNKAKNTNVDSVGTLLLCLIYKLNFIIGRYISVQFSHSGVFDSLWPHGLQHTRLPCPSAKSRNLLKLTSIEWVTPSNYLMPFSSCLQPFPASGSFPMSQFFASGGHSIRVSASASVLPMNIQDWFPSGLTSLISLQNKVCFSSVQLLSRVWLFVTPWTAAHQASPCPSPTPRVYPNSRPLSWWCHPTISSCVVTFSSFPNPPQSFPASGSYPWVSSSHQVAKVLEFQLHHQSFQWTLRTISFRMDLLDLFAVQGTLKSLIQHLSSKASILRCSAFFTVQLSTSWPSWTSYMTTGKTTALTRQTFVGKVMQEKT